ncbi:MAG: uracil phosphoribosyltransferase [Candidatus Limnocylindrales bacterium]
MSPVPAILHKLAVLRDVRHGAQEVPRGRARAELAARLRGAPGCAHAAAYDPHARWSRWRQASSADRIGLIPILRAGLGMVDAMLELMPTAAGLAPGPVPRRADPSTGRVLQQAARLGARWTCA